MNNQKAAVLSQRLKFILVLLFVYIALFEFILPPGRVLPRPTILLESLSAIWSDYNFLYELSVSTLIIYGAFIVAFSIIYVLRAPLIKFLLNFSGGLELFRVFRFFPAVFYAVIFAYWFPGSLVAEGAFLLIAILFYLIVSIMENIPNVNKDFLLIARNLGAGEKELITEVTWNELLPSLFKSMKRMHFFAWILVILFEFIGDFSGLGHVYRSALSYNDFAGLFSIAIYISLLILLGDYLVDFSKQKLVYWDK